MFKERESGYIAVKDFLDGLRAQYSKQSYFYFDALNSRVERLGRVIQAFLIF